MTFPTMLCRPAADEEHGRPIDGHRRFLGLVALISALTILANCAVVGTGTTTRETADQVLGIAATPDSRQARLELGVLYAIIIMADNTLDGGSSADAGALAAKVEALTAALQRARSAPPELRELQIARTVNELATLTGSRMKRLVAALIGSGGVPSEDQIVAFIRSASTGEAAIAGIKVSVAAIEAGERTLVQAQSAVDAELAVQIARLESASKPR